MSVHLTQFKELFSAVEKFRIFDFSKLTNIQEFEEGKGLDTDLSDIFQTNERELFVLLKDGSIRKTVIHIVDISSYWEKDWEHPKFHIYNCKTVEQMRQNQRGHRYKVSGRRDGQFFLIKKDKEWYEPLKICSHCLKIFNEKFKQDKNKKTFKIKDYLNKTFSSDVPKINMELDICTVPNRYSDCWPEISERRKEQENYKCEKCRIDLSRKKYKKFLHTHHVDGNKANNTKENLTVLCIECHAKEFSHSHIRELPQCREFIKKKREQGL